MLCGSPAVAQNPPAHFQYGESRATLNGDVCTYLMDIKIVAGNVLVAPLSQKCQQTSQDFSGEEGHILPFGAERRGARKCKIPAGTDPVMTCDDGEARRIIGMVNKEPLRVDAQLYRASRWEGGRLILDVQDVETRFTLAGGSGRRPQRLQTTFHMEFTFSGGKCSADVVKRVRVLNGRRANPVSVAPLPCKVLG